MSRGRLVYDVAEDAAARAAAKGTEGRLRNLRAAADAARGKLTRACGGHAPPPDVAAPLEAATVALSALSAAVTCAVAPRTGVETREPQRGRSNSNENRPAGNGWQGGDRGR